ncbi:MAG: apolipoprotein N-acyltransferase [Candidatus Omnitrophica bacterium]|jgi:apolipoprotein N-acyltransferase|nr:apolipoprotein N-acyltransferase [Candidatus Omnitrophota bacterium]
MNIRVYFKEILLVLLYVVLQSAIFHLPQAWPLGFVSLVPLLFVIYLCPGRKEALYLGGLAGFLQTAGTFYWILHVTKFGYLAMCVYLSVYTALFAVLAFGSVQVLGRSGTDGFGWGWIKTLTLASLWVLIEFVRSYIPVMRFPWALLGYSQWKNLPFIQSADVWGAFGVSFALAFFAVGVFGAWMLAARFGRGEMKLDKYAAQLILIAGLPLLLAGLNIGYGLNAIHDIKAAQTQAMPHSRVAVVQGNIPQEQKWDARIQEMIFRKYDGLSRQVIMESPDLVVWPETSFPGFWEAEPELTQRVSSLAREIPSELFIGTPTYRESQFGVDKMNSAIHISKAGKELKRYHKTHLVPFGEYVPFFKFIRRFFDDIGHFAPGEELTLFKTPVRWNYGVTPDTHPRAFSALICFEDIFPDLCRKFVRKGSSMLINITNDAWFKNSTGPYQHAQSSVFRAVENRVPVVRSANTGLSCYIDTTGRVVDTLKDNGRELMVAGFKVFDVALNHTTTLYTTFGDWLVVALLIIFVLSHRLLTNKLDTTPTDDLE